MTSARTETVSTADGRFGAHVVVPAAESGPGILVLQEIFGVNTYIRSVCDRLASLGYVALAPDVFWRQHPDFTVEPDQGEEGFAAAMAMAQGYDWSHVAADLGAAFDHLATMAETVGRVGVMGFCFGGTLAFHAAADLRPACAVSYYGSGVAAALDEKADAVECPILFHFGDDDPYLPNADVARVQDVFAARHDALVVVQHGAGHAFDNHTSAVFSEPKAAAAAWRVTDHFLAQHLST